MPQHTQNSPRTPPNQMIGSPHNPPSLSSRWDGPRLPRNVMTLSNLDLSLEELQDLRLEWQLNSYSGVNPQITMLLKRLKRRRDLLTEWERLKRNRRDNSFTEWDDDRDDDIATKRKGDGDCDGFLSGERSCSICFDGFKGNVTCLKCGHVFHSACLRAWYDHITNEGVEGDRCPLCRRVYLGDSVLQAENPGTDTRPASVLTRTWKRGSISRESQDVRPFDLDLY